MREPSSSDIEKDHSNVSLNPRAESISKSPARARLSFSLWGKNCQTNLQLTPFPPGGNSAPQRGHPGPLRQDTHKGTRHPPLPESGVRPFCFSRLLSLSQKCNKDPAACG